MSPALGIGRTYDEVPFGRILLPVIVEAEYWPVGDTPPEAVGEIE